jgi:RNA polymerase sigma-70 factor (ECF subfamily)
MAANNDSSIVRMLARARAGDQRELGRLFEACRSYLGVIARTQMEGWMQAKLDASDIVQETLLEAHRDFARFQGDTSAEWLAWLRGILSNNAADLVRKYRGTEKRQTLREVRLKTPADDSAVRGVPELADAIETPSVQLMRQERELHLADAIVQLAPDYQEVIVLRNLQRLPFEAVAKRMGRSRPAVQMLWLRAIRKLQEVLASDA